MKKRRLKKKIKPKRQLFYNEDVIYLALQVIGLIIILYGAWFHNLLWLLLGFISLGVGNWWNKVHKNGKRK